MPEHAALCPLCGSSDVPEHPADSRLLACNGCAETLERDERVHECTPQTATAYVIRNGLVGYDGYQRYLDADDHWCPDGYRLGNGGSHQVTDGSCDLCGAKNFS